MLVRNGTWRRGDANPGAEAVAPAADGDAQPDAAALAAACPTPPRQGQMTPLPLRSAARPALASGVTPSFRARFKHR